MSADFWAGYVSGAVGIIIGNPLDLVKTRLQAGPSAPAAEANTSTAAAPRGFKGQFENAGILVRGEFGAPAAFSTVVSCRVCVREHAMANRSCSV
jgi:hypothetical protein